MDKENYSSLRYCIICGNEFLASTEDTALCPSCGGPPEPRKSKDSGETWLQPFAKPSPNQVLSQPHPWNVSDWILDTYEIKQIFSSGGMGLVYRVHHHSWGIDLALKSPRPEIFTTDHGQQNFIQEAETWVNLGLHPHIVTCFYVRSIAGIPRIFAEFVAGGSLRDWIRNRQLYAGGKIQALERILDTLIQFAWGLQYAHQMGLIHQDIKPANVLMTSEGIAKVSDFGLAKARLVAGDQSLVEVSGGGYTPAYCSPEQENHEPLTFKTDIWSWGVSVLEIFCGEISWHTGQAAGMALEVYLESGVEDERIPSMPVDLVELLRSCFQKQSERRPKDVQTIADGLIKIFEKETHRPYYRKQPQPADQRAGSLNNKALSLLDLNREAEALALFQEALSLDPYNPQSAYNLGMIHWRSGIQPNDLALVSQLEAIAAASIDDWSPRYLLGLAHLERGDAEAANTALMEASRLSPAENVIQEALRNLSIIKETRCLQVYEGHQDHVQKVAFLPGSATIVSASGQVHDDWNKAGDNTLRLWSFQPGSHQPGVCIRKVGAHHDAITSLVLSQDGRFVVTGGQDSDLRVWDTQTWTCKNKINIGYDHKNQDLALSPDGRLALTVGGVPVLIRMWEIETGKCVRTYHPRSFRPYRIAITPDGTKMLWAGRGLIQVRTFDEQAKILFQIKSSPPLALRQDGKILVTTGEGGIEIWDLQTGDFIQRFASGDININAIVISPDGNLLIAGCYDGAVRVISLINGRILRTFLGHLYETGAVNIHQDGQYIVSGAHDHTVRVWGMAGLGKVKGEFALCRPTSAGQAVEASSLVEQVVSSVEELLAQRSFIEAGEAIRKARALPGYEQHPALVDLWHQAGCCGGRRIGLLGWRRINEKPILPRDNSMISDLLDGVVWQGQHRLDLEWDIKQVNPEYASPRELAWQKLRMYKGVDHLYLLHSGKYAVTAGNWSEGLRVWDVYNQYCLRKINADGSYTQVFSLTPDERYAIMGGKGHTLQQIDLANGNRIAVFTGHSQNVIVLAITPDGKKAVSGGEDSMIHVWRLAQAGQVLVEPISPSLTFDEHQGHISLLAISPDGQFILSDSTGSVYDNVAENRWFRSEKSSQPSPANGKVPIDTLCLWNLETGERLGILDQISSLRYALGFSRDGRYAFVRLNGGSVIAYELDWDYEFLASQSWDPQAQPFLEGFIIHHTSVGMDGLTLIGMPYWEESDFQQLLTELGCRGYGWMEPEALRIMLDFLSRMHSTNAVKAAIVMDGVRHNISNEQPDLAGMSLRSGAAMPGFFQDPVNLQLWQDLGQKTGRRTGLHGARLVHNFDRHHDSIYRLTVTKDEKTLLTAGGGTRTQLNTWDIPSGKHRQTIKTGKYVNGQLAVSPDGKVALCGTFEESNSYQEENTALWNLETGEIIQSLKDSRSPLAIAPDGKWVVTSTRFETIRIWDLNAENTWTSLKGTCSPIAISPGGRLLVTGSGNREIINLELAIWDTGARKPIRRLSSITAPATNIVFTPNGSHILVATEDHQLVLWRVNAFRPQQTWTFPQPIDLIAASAGGERILVVDKTEDGKGFYVCNPADGSALALSGHTKRIGKICITKDGRFGFSAGYGGSLRIWDLDNRSCLKELNHDDEICAMRLLDDERYLISALAEGNRGTREQTVHHTLLLWELIWDYEFGH